MPNKNYIKGVRKERKYVNLARDKGYISFRSAGSHSPIDVIIIDKERKIIELIQCKPDSMSENKKNEIVSAHTELNGTFQVSFKVL